MAGLVLEGGAFRGLFTAGVLDALLDMGAYFPYVIGVSAGATNACSYISRQRGRNLEIMDRFLSDKRYFGLRNLLGKNNRAVMDMNFVFDEIPGALIPFDYETFNSYSGSFLSGVCDIITGETKFFNKDEIDEHNNVLRASCSIPMLFPPVTIDGVLYADGGLSDPIPLHKSIEDGNRKNLVVLTRPLGYKKATGTRERATALYYRSRYPGLSRAVLTRARVYNSSLKYLKSLFAKGEAVVLAPPEEIVVSRFERSKEVLHRLYKSGYDMAMAKKTNILGLLG